MSPELAEVGDPNDPAVILRDLPEQERAEFLCQYYAAVNAAHDPGGYRQLQGLLHAWRLTAIATSRVGYYEELAAVHSGTAQTSPAEKSSWAGRSGWRRRGLRRGDLPVRARKELLTWSETRSQRWS